MALPDGLRSLSQEDGYVFVNYTATPRDAVRAMSIRELVRRRAVVGYHERGHKYALAEQHERHQGDEKERMRRNMSKFRITRTSYSRMPGPASNEAHTPV
jgi:hypothetical protein